MSSISTHFISENTWSTTAKNPEPAQDKANYIFISVNARLGAGDV